MKLGPLLASFLYQYRRLDLPGIGSFLIDHTEISEGSKIIVPGVSFETNLSAKEDPELIDYISEQTGKMKALAAADFHSYLQLAQQFLNIGKPFLFEGIGSLVKKKAGGFAFAPAEQPQQAGEYSAREISATASSEESFHSAREPKLRISSRKLLYILLAAASLIVVIWGGYALSKRSKSKTTPSKEDQLVVPAPPQPKDTAAREPRRDSLKYVLETAARERALERYQQLRSYGWKVRVEIIDSLQYRIFLMLDANADSVRMRDSLSFLTGRPVTIEH
ncbi:MAG TPA: hypothetical protein VEB63_06400 [Chitinophagaceae bacterium]|nr:hypothetical protein [Chitinophagaceae bacterium]